MKPNSLTKVERMAFERFPFNWAQGVDLNASIRMGFIVGYEAALKAAEEVAGNHELAWLESDVEMHAGTIAKDIRELGK